MISNTLPLSLTDNPILSQWIAFEPGKVRIATGKVEIGQGIVTAMTQIAAEELDVRPDQIRIVSGETDVSPSEYFTSGSYSVSVGGAAIRLVCAEVRSMLLDKVAEALRCPVGELSIEEGQFLRGGKPTGRDYWSMAPTINLDRRASGTAPTKSPSKYKIVGKSLPRLDLPAKVTGAAFIHDIAVEGVVHARMLRQPWKGAKLASLDEAAVRKAAKAPIDIIHDGEFVAFTGTSELAVMRAAEAASERAKWEGGTPAPDDIGSPQWLKAQPARSRTVEQGEKGRMPQGPVVTAKYSRPFLTYGSIGPSCALAEFKDGALKVWSHTQGPSILRDWLAKALGLETKQVTVFHRMAAGAYGHNTADDCAFDASYIAMKMPGRTVRVQLSREDEFLSAPISTAMAIELTAVLDADNKPADWQIEIWSPPHAQRPGMNGNSNFISASALPNPPPMKELNDIGDERGGGATRNGYCDLRPAAAPADPSHDPRRAAAHLVAARARRLGQCVCDRILHGRTGRDRGRGSRDVSAVAALRSTPAQGDRNRGADERVVRQEDPARRPRPRLRLRALQEHRRLRRGGGRRRGRRGSPPQAHLGGRRRGSGDLAGRRQEPGRGRRRSRAPASS